MAAFTLRERQEDLRARYSFAMQFYLGPMTLYRAKESRAIVVFVAFIAWTFIEMFVFGTTVGF